MADPAVGEAAIHRTFYRRLYHALRGSLILAIFATLVSGCSGLDILNSLTLDRYHQPAGDFAYGPDARQMLRVHRPVAGDPPYPVVVFFYGGAWQEGRKEDYAFVADALGQAGYMTVIPDYRLYPEVTYPDFILDGARAVGWVRENIESHGGHPEKIILGGHSSGAHTAISLMVDPSYFETVSVDGNPVGGAFGLSGPYAFEPTGVYVDIFTGPDGELVPQPAYRVSGASPPVWLATGQRDTTVDPRNTTVLAENLREAGTKVETRSYSLFTHSMTVAFLAGLLRPFSSLYSDLVRFLDRNSLSPPESSEENP